MSEWMQANLDFYCALTVAQMRRFASASGMDELPEIPLIAQAVRQAPRILELGGGYGRFTAGAFEQWGPGSYVVVEPVAQFADALEELRRPGLTVVRSTALDYLRQSSASNDGEECFDLIVWPWSGITESPPAEQASLISAARQRLARGGWVFFDVVVRGSQGNGTERRGNEYLIQANEHQLRGYVPTLHESVDMLGSAEEIRFIRYKSRPERERRIALARWQ